MRVWRRGLLVLGIAASVLASGAALQSEQTKAGESANLVRSELILELRNVAVAFSPSLRATDPAHRQLLAASNGSTDMRVRVAELEGHPSLRIGTVEPTEGEGEESSMTYDLWLAATDTGWELQVHRASGSEPPEHPDRVGTIPLSRRAATSVSPAFTAALVPTADDGGKLVLRWGGHEWTADFRFEQQPDEAEDRDRAGEDSNEGDRRERDTDTTAISRGITLTERNMTALVRPDGSRLRVLFWKKLASDGEDFDRIGSTTDGAVVPLIHGAAIRLRSDVALRVGDASLPTDNLAPGYPGTYGLWLKRAGDGWRLVFNHEADSWGTQHDPAFDAAEVDLAYSDDGASSRPLGVALVPTGDDQGQLVIHWGPHEWTAGFAVDE